MKLSEKQIEILQYAQSRNGRVSSAAYRRSWLNALAKKGLLQHERLGFFFVTQLGNDTLNLNVEN